MKRIRIPQPSGLALVAMALAGQGRLPRCTAEAIARQAPRAIPADDDPIGGHPGTLLVT